MIYFNNNQKDYKITEDRKKDILQILEYALEQEKVFSDVEISIVFVDNEEIKDINKKYRNIDKVTDVLSFPLLDYPLGKVFKDVYAVDESLLEENIDDGVLMLGDIIISMDRVSSQSKEYNHSLERELCYLVTHSLLHLLGYDHMDEGDKLRMREREEYIMEKFSLSR